MSLFDNWFFIVFLLFYASYLLVEIGLDFLNINNINKHKSSIPKLFADIFSKEEYKKSIEYTKAKTNFRLFGLIFQACLILLLINFKFFGEVDLWLGKIFGEYKFLHAIAYPFFIGLVFYVIGLPQSYYYQFVLEEKFGFNKMDLKTFFLDQIKVIFLSIILGAPLFAALLYVIEKTGENWWIWGFAIFMGFQLFIAAIYPVFLAPLFNKFTPLADGSLKERINNLAKKINFKMSGIFTIDGSKRSSHSNAFFAGIGSMRRIVLFDTLVEKQSEDEILSILAHEMGHNVKQHMQKTLIISSVVMLALFYVLSLCIKWPLFFNALGAFEPNIHVGLVLFAIFSSIFTFPMTPFFNLLSRKHEYEADRFAIEVTKEKEQLKSALVKLSKENLSNLTPHPWYSTYHYSHPTTLERVKAIDEISITEKQV